MSSLCPFANTAHGGDHCPRKVDANDKHQSGPNNRSDIHNPSSRSIPPKCPFGYDSHTFKLGPLSCMICQALLFDSSKCVPCYHKFCKVCVSRFKDCPLCGADIHKIEPDRDLQTMVDHFIEGHARIKRSQVNKDSNEVEDEQKNVIYEDVSLERGAFLVQHAMRAFQAHNYESAKSRLVMCSEDIHEELERLGNSTELCSQLGAVFGMLGDCCRAMGDTTTAGSYYEESVKFLQKLTAKDLELVHTLSVSLNKLGDLKFYDGNLQSARSYYSQSLDVRRTAAKEQPNISSQVVDLAVSLAKVADVDRNLGNESAAVGGFKEAISCLESLKLDPSESNLEQRRRSVLSFLNQQLEEERQNSATVGSE